MQVNGGSKMRNLLAYALKAFDEEGAIVWSGSGAGLSKAVSCVEIMKRKYKEVYQMNKICYRKVEEYWDPLCEDMDSLVVQRDIPTIHILLSKNPLDVDEPGYQGPASAESLEVGASIPRKENKPVTPQRKHKSVRVLGQFTPKNPNASRKNSKKSLSRMNTALSNETSANVVTVS